LRNSSCRATVELPSLGGGTDAKALCTRSLAFPLRPSRAAGLLLGLTCVLGAARADMLITDFNNAPLGSYNPREGWSAFGYGTTDRGVHIDGSVGRGAYHTVNWADSTWGIGDSEAFRDLSAYTAIRVDARVVSLEGHTGTPLLRLSFNMADGSEWSAPTVPLTGTYQTYTFEFSTLYRTAGSGPLVLTNAQPKLTVRKNNQTGRARFDFDEIVAIGAGADPYQLSPVVLWPPPDGDNIRAVWLYAGTKFDTAAASQAVLDFCAREGVNRIYCGAYSIWALGSEVQKSHLRTFIATAHASGIRVEAECGDTGWHNNPTLVRTRIDQILALHNATPENAADDFDAIHFDVEFWLDSSWTSAPDEAARQQIARNYLDNVLVNARNYLNAQGATGIDIAVDLSTHFNSSGMLPSPMVYNGVTQYFVEHVLDHVDDVVFMSYYDSVSSLLNTTSHELDWAAAKGRRVQLGANIQPGELSINTFADNLPTAFAAMTTTLEDFHDALSPARRAALDGFSIFHYDGYAATEPQPHYLADLDGDGDVDGDDFTRFECYLWGPGVSAAGPARDRDFNLDGAVALDDFALFARCFTGSGGGGSSPAECQR